ncbi:MAG: hypothetical protein RIT43_2351 [Bacteroidota bacterium]
MDSSLRSEFLTEPQGDQRWSSYFLTFMLVLLAYGFLGQLPLLFYASGNPELLSYWESGNISGMSQVLGENRLLFFLLCPFILTFIILLVALPKIHKWPFLSIFTSASRFDIRRFMFSFGIWFAILSLFLAVTFFSTDNLKWNVDSSTLPALILISILIIPIQTTCEEVIFRNYLPRGLNRLIRSPLQSVLISGVLFGLVHGSNPEIKALGPIALSYYVFTGIFLGIIAWKDNGLELSMGYHAANNIFSALIVTNNWQAFQTDALFLDTTPPSFGWDSILTMLLIQPLILLLFSKIYSWKWR